MSKPSFVYTIYIHAEAEKVWRGLIDPEFTRIYWMGVNLSDWEVGAKWEHRRPDENGEVFNGGEVVEYDEPKRMTWTWARAGDEGIAERTSRVTFEIAPQDWPAGPWVSLTITHDELESDPEMLGSISFGWPALASGLKTLLESPELMPKP